MKQSAIDREKSRDAITGYLPSPKPIDFHIKDNIEVVNKQEWEDIENEFEKTHRLALGDEYGGYTTFLYWLQENYFAPEKKNT